MHFYTVVDRKDTKRAAHLHLRLQNPLDSHRVFDMVKGVSGKQNVEKAEVLIMMVFGQILGPSLINLCGLEQVTQSH